MTTSTKQTTQLDYATQKLANYKKIIDADIESYGRDVLRQWQKDYGASAQVHLKSYIDILSRGGKRLRGALAMYAYEMAGGQNKELAKIAARCIEAIHAYLLIVDDVADKSARRRGGPSAHEQLANYHKAHKWHGDSRHYGESQAVHTALAGAHLAIQEITNLSVSDSYKLKALAALNAGLATTVAGQIRDVYDQAVREISESEVRKVLTMKTAYYSFLNPLEFGLTLAGKTLDEYSWLKLYATHVGLSFQVVDDILGTFGDSKESGKGNTDDLSEGKITVLIAHALNNANSKQHQELLSVLGKEHITRKEYELAKKIIQETGALDYSRQLADTQAKLAIKVLKDAPSDLNTDFLASLATYVTERNS